MSASEVFAPFTKGAGVVIFDHEGNEMDQGRISQVILPGTRGKEKPYGDVFLESQVVDPGEKYGFRYVEDHSSGVPDGWYCLWGRDPGSNEYVWSTRQPPYKLEVVH